jgi:hypothetical protein
MEINNYQQLLDFIKRDDVTAKQASEVVCKALNVLIIFEITKEELIKCTENYITQWSMYEGERPLFLEQKGTDFNIKDIFKSE